MTERVIPSGEPVTEAGRALNERGIAAGAVLTRAIVAIEREAATPGQPAEAVAALHEWREANGGCEHFDKGYGPYAQCEDPDDLIPSRAAWALTRLTAPVEQGEPWALLVEAIPDDPYEARTLVGAGSCFWCHAPEPSHYSGCKWVKARAALAAREQGGAGE